MVAMIKINTHHKQEVPLLITQIVSSRQLAAISNWLKISP